MKELSKEEAKKLPEGTIIKIYNPLTNTWKEEKASKKDLAHSRYAYEKLRYFIEEDK